MSLALQKQFYGTEWCTVPGLGLQILYKKLFTTTLVSSPVGNVDIFYIIDS